MSEKCCNLIIATYNSRSDNRSLKFQPTGSKSLPPYIVQHIDSIRGDYPRSKLVLALIKKSLELKEAATVK